MFIKFCNNIFKNPKVFKNCAVIHTKGTKLKETTKMGMAASQARLLSITARIHDVEHQAQSIQNAKLALATQSDQAYNDYVKALDATSLTLNALNTKTGETSIIAATFNNLCSRSRATAADGSNYALRNRDGKLIVEDDVEQAYYKFTVAVT